MSEYDLILNELTTIRSELVEIKTRVGIQNGRVSQAERDILILKHDADREDREELEKRADVRQDKLLMEFSKLFDKYLRPAVTMGGILYLIFKLNGWVP